MPDGRFFDQAFQALTGWPPLGWQRRLFAEHFAVFDPPRVNLPATVDLPTGLGKTSVIVIWLLALAWRAENNGVRLPRRLVYVVNRRTVVDQATDIAERLRRVLKTAAAGSIAAQIRDRLNKLCIDPTDEASPLAISTLRGERADNREWQADPARATIIVGTVDMIGSRLLFSGYGVSRRMRPFHGGLLGQDTLLIHDEAHLSEPFGKLLHTIAEIQQTQKAPRPLRVMELSATQRDETSTAFVMTASEKSEAEAVKRLQAIKRLHFEAIAEDKDDAIAKVVELALRYKDERKRVLVYVRSPNDACEIADRLTRATASSRVALLTGTIRSYERDALAETALFKGFRSDPDRQPPEATEYLVATSAGEVGIDLDADHLVCDLTTLDSMIQRLGRVNRLGGKDRQANVHVVEWPVKKDEGEKGKLDQAIVETKTALASLPKCDDVHDASPESLRALADRTAAFAPSPRTVELTDILVDNWALTRVKDLPGRPMPERWLHGIEAGEPDLYVAWREEVSELAACLRNENRNSIRILKQLYDKHPILARERLRGPLSQVKRELEKIAKRNPKTAESTQVESEEREPPQPIQAILLSVNGDPVVGALSDLLERETELSNATIVLPPSAGGLDERGMLADDERFAPERSYDVADDLGASSKEQRRRLRILLERKEGDGWSARVLGQAIDIPVDLAEQLAGERIDKVPSRLIRDHFAGTCTLAERALLVIEEDDEGPSKALQLLGASRAATIVQDDPAAAARPQELDEHLSWARDEAEKVVERIGLRATNPTIAEAVAIAAHWHDRGKDRPEWQKAIGNPPPRKGGDGTWKPWAKSGQRGFDESACGSYRHEFGSLREAEKDETIRRHPERDLILHLIAAHHGWARPHFEPDQWDIADGVSEEENATVAAETLRRFARLQRRFGHWGLAWLESLVRAADYAASGRLAASPAASADAPTNVPSPASEALKESTA
ncbi:MAG TPA: type I-U CRISPR-associated helicase/endonuclease Cas3 [Xanthobacteraceae bacterium]|nr:type I-U CRISPR-associated helicase/endonuclease Cas3 [Xanthobacteraceae bacterium]